MAKIKGLVRALRYRRGWSAKAAAAAALSSLAHGNDANKVAIAAAGGIPPLVQLLRGSAEAKEQAVRALCSLTHRSDANTALVAAAGGIPALVDLLREGRELAAWLLWRFATGHKVLIVEAGGIPPLVDLLRDGSRYARLVAAMALGLLEYNNDGNAVAIAVAVGLDALVELALGGDVTVDDWTLVSNFNAGIAAKRKAALVVAALLGDCVPDSVPREIKALIGPYL